MTSGSASSACFGSCCGREGAGRGAGPGSGRGVSTSLRASTGREGEAGGFDCRAGCWDGASTEPETTRPEPDRSADGAEACSLGSREGGETEVLDSSSAPSISFGAVIVVPHFGHGADTPARWVGTRSFAWQFEQVNLSFFKSICLSRVGAGHVLRRMMRFLGRDEPPVGGIRDNSARFLQKPGRATRKSVTSTGCFANF